MDRSAIDRALTFYEEVTLRRNLFTPPTGFSSRLPFESAELVRDAWNLYIQSGATPRIALYAEPLTKSSPVLLGRRGPGAKQRSGMRSQSELSMTT
jgi:hypothetical protein